MGLLGNVPNYGLLGYPSLLQRLKEAQRPQDAPEIAQTVLNRAGNSTAWGDAVLGATGLPSLATAAHIAQPNNWLSTADDAAQHWGDKTLAATGSPALATGVHTGLSIFGDPMDLVPALKVGGLAAAGAGGLGWLMRQGGDLSDVRRIAPDNQMGIIGYHGSPHRINNVDDLNPMGRFDLEKIGTGEGAQAYGHGIYLAETPGVAKSYQFVDAHIDPDVVSYNGKSIDDLYEAAQRKQARGHRSGNQAEISKANAELGFWENLMTRQHPDQVIADALADPDDWPERYAFVKNLDRDKFKGVEQAGHFYEVDLPDEHIANMLDWDAPLSEQPESVRKALLDTPAGQRLKQQMQDARDAFGDGAVEDWMSDYSGQSLYKEMAEELGADGASAEMRKLGIPGIKYFDGSSRAAGEGTRNFVVFDPDITTILSRNGERAAQAIVRRGDGVAMSQGDDLIGAAKKTMGVTHSTREAGYVLPDGALLDFSGKREGGPSGMRALDHRDIFQAFDEAGIDTEGGTDGMIQFMRETGAVRFHESDDIVIASVNGTPSDKQIQALSKAARRKADGIVIGVDDAKGNELAEINLMSDQVDPQTIRREIDKALDTKAAGKSLHNAKQKDLNEMLAGDDWEKAWVELNDRGFSDTEVNALMDRAKGARNKAAPAIGAAGAGGLLMQEEERPTSLDGLLGKPMPKKPKRKKTSTTAVRG